ncbi:MAG TPA: hypothetical protein VGC44_03995 [Longimicrobiales bacterium]
MMNELWLAVLLSTSPAPCCYDSPRFAVQVSSAEETRDNIGHFVAPTLVTASVYGTAVYLGASRKQARWIAVGTSVLLIVGKEVYDESVAGRFGLEETLIGLGGTAAGLVLAETLDGAEAKKQE